MTLFLLGLAAGAALVVAVAAVALAIASRQVFHVCCECGGPLPAHCDHTLCLDCQARLAGADPEKGGAF